MTFSVLQSSALKQIYQNYTKNVLPLIFFAPSKSVLRYGPGFCCNLQLLVDLLMSQLIVPAFRKLYFQHMKEITFQTDCLGSYWLNWTIGSLVQPGIRPNYHLDIKSVFMQTILIPDFVQFIGFFSIGIWQVFTMDQKLVQFYKNILKQTIEKT